MAQIVRLHDLADEKGEFHQFLDDMKKDSTRAIFIVTDKSEQMKLGCTAQNPAELIIMLHHLRRYTEYLVDTYSASIFDAKNEGEDERDDGDYVN